MDRACSSDGEMRGICMFSFGKTEKLGPRGKPWLRWEDDINMDIQEVECGGMDWI
jgi:hypothetical protein